MLIKLCRERLVGDTLFERGYIQLIFPTVEENYAAASMGGIACCVSVADVSSISPLFQLIKANAL